MAEHGAIADRYQLLKELRAGVTGTAWVAEDPDVDGPVVLQLLPRPRQRRALGDRLFLGNARAAASLSHPHLANVLDFGVEESHRWLATDVTPDHTLATVLRTDTPLADILTATISALRGLAHAHSQGVYHGGLVPESIWFCGSRVVLGDLAVDRKELGLETPETLMAPEQRHGRGRSAPADVYAAGALLWWAATGSPLPQHGPTPRVHRQEKVPAWLDRVLVRCLARHPSRRFPNAGALVRALERGKDAMRPEDVPESPLMNTEGQQSEGRRLAYEQLRTWAELAADGAGQVVLVTGARGTGRTWLLRQALADVAVPLWRVSFSANDGGLQHLLRTISGCPRSSPEEEQTWVREWARSAEIVDHADVDTLGSLMAQRNNLPLSWPAAVARLLAQSSRHTPAWLVLEDCERGPTGLESFLLLLAERLSVRSDARLLLAATWTTGGDTTLERVTTRLARWPAGQILHVHAMNEAESRAFAVRALGTSPRTAAWLASQGQGNGSHMRELFRRLLERGDVIPGPRGWELANPAGPGDLGEEPLEERLRRVLSVSSLPMEPVLTRLALLGGEASVEELSRLLKTEEADGDGLWRQWVPTVSALMERQLLRASPGRRGGRVALTSPELGAALTSGARLAALGPHRQRRLAMLIADGGRVADLERCTAAARLLALAGDQRAAADLLVRWAIRNLPRDRGGEGAEALSRALSLLGDEDPELRLLRAALLVRAGRADEAHDELAHLLAVVADVAARARVLALTAALPGTPPHQARQLAEQAQALLPERPAPGPWLSRAWAWEMARLVQVDANLALGRLDEATAHLEALDAAGPTHVNRELGLVAIRIALLRGRGHQAEQLASSLLAIDSLGAELAAEAHRLLARASLAMGEPLYALRRARAALRLAVDHGSDLLVNRAELTLLEVLIAAGRNTWADQLAQAVLIRTRNGDDDLLMGRSLWLLGQLRRRQGDLEAARTACRQALIFFQRQGAWERHAVAVELGWIHLRCDEVASAKSELEPALDALGAAGIVHSSDRARIGLAWACTLDGDTEHARAHMALLSPGALEEDWDPDVLTAGFSLR